MTAETGLTSQPWAAITAIIRPATTAVARNQRNYSYLGAKQRHTTTSTGVIEMGARLYVPQLGRFLQSDPVHGGSANLYDYTNQDPVNLVDLDGMIPSGGPGSDGRYSGGTSIRQPSKKPSVHPVKRVIQKRYRTDERILFDDRAKARQKIGRRAIKVVKVTGGIKAVRCGGNLLGLWHSDNACDPLEALSPEDAG